MNSALDTLIAFLNFLVKKAAAERAQLRAERDEFAKKCAVVPRGEWIICKVHLRAVWEKEGCPWCALDGAVELAEEAIGYTDSYFREKWNMDRRLSDLKKV